MIGVRDRKGVMMSLDGVQSDGPQTCIPRRWRSRDRLVLTILRSPGMMGSALFLILMFGGVGYTSFSSMLEEGLPLFDLSTSDGWFHVLLVAVILLIFFMSFFLLFSYSVVDSEGLHLHRFIVIWWWSRDVSWDDFRWGSFLKRTASNGAVTATLCVSSDWRSWEPEEGEEEEFLNTYYPPIMTARGCQIPGLRGVGVSGLAGARRVALAWRQIVDWAEYKGYLRQGDTRPGMRC